MRITIATLLEMLANLPAGTFIHLVTATPARLKIKASKEAGFINPKDAIKVSEFSTQIGVDYSNKVNNQREREGLEKDFVSESPFYDFESENKVVAKGKKNPKQKYLVHTPFKNSHPISEYLIDNKVLTKADIPASCFPDKSGSSRQGTATEIVWRTVKAENIRKVSMNGQTYDIVECV